MLVTGRADGEPTMVEVGFGTGLADQPVAQLGVVELLGAWLVVNLGRPTESLGGDGGVERPYVSFTTTPDVCVLTVAGESGQVSDVLGRLFDGLLLPGAVEVSDGVRDRARGHGVELRRWRSHLAARWPGVGRLAHALGPLALDALGTDDLEAARDRFAAAPRACWTNDAELADHLAARQPAAAADRPAFLLASEPRSAPGCVMAQQEGELFSVAMRDDPAGQIALAVLSRALWRRLVDFDAVATDLRLQVTRLAGRTVMAHCVAAVLAGRGDALRRGVVETVEDIAAGSLSAEEIGRVRDGLAEAERSADPAHPDVAARLVRRHLVDGDFPLPARLAADLATTSDDAVRAALAAAGRQLLLAVPPDAAADPAGLPYELAERIEPRPASGRRFRDWTAPARALRISPDRIGITIRMPAHREGEKGRRWPRPVTVASVDVDDLFLRMDTGAQATTLIDRDFRAVEVVWGVHRHATQARRAVDAATATLPAIRLPPDPTWPEQLARAHRRRRRGRLAVAGGVAAVAAIFTLLALHPVHGDHKTNVALGAAGTARLANGTSLAIAAGPEMIEHYGADVPYLYAVKVRACAGREQDGRDGGNLTARNYFDARYFALRFADTTLPPSNAIVPDRPQPYGVQLGDGECATGWLLFATPAAVAAGTTTLRFANYPGDQVTWSLPAKPARSPLSRPCPPSAPIASRGLGDPPWAGCPD